MMIAIFFNIYDILTEINHEIINRYKMKRYFMNKLLIIIVMVKYLSIFWHRLNQSFLLGTPYTKSYSLNSIYFSALLALMPVTCSATFLTAYIFSRNYYSFKLRVLSFFAEVCADFRLRKKHLKRINITIIIVNTAQVILAIMRS